MVEGAQVRSERRSAERFTLSWPVETNRGPGVTRDMSLSGLYLVTGERFAVGEQVRLTVSPSEAGRPLPIRLSLVGRVVRVEEHRGALGAGIALDEESARMIGAA